MSEEKTTKKKVEKAKEKVEEVIDSLDDEVKSAIEDFISHQRKAAEEAGKALESIIPEGVKEHGKAAFKEMVEGYRNLFNAVMDEVNETIDKVKPGGSSEAGIEVEAEVKVEGKAASE